jgi:U4/U6 small nuclear ribonucleoprotein PRP3
MLQRIDWAALPDDDAEAAEDATANFCDLVWEGSVQKPAFERFSVEVCIIKG